MNILVIDDEPAVRADLVATITACDHQAEAVSSFKSLHAWSDSKLATFDAAFIDKKLEGDEDGLQLGPTLVRRSSRLQLIMLTGVGSIADAVTAMKYGYFDFLPKPATADEIKAVLDRVELCADRIRERVPRAVRIIGRSPGIERAVTDAVKAARTNAHVLITGETGTGKELLAELVHECSNRSEQPFVKVNCAAVPDTLLESELFGHKRGAFTGAIADKKGRFELADGGTIFLDEIAEMNLVGQAKLLRVLQKGEFERLGAERTTRVDVRLISATNRTLENRVASGTFREDLFYRISVIGITIPPLRERLEDIPLLADRFLKQFCQETNKRIPAVSQDALATLARYSWPGNVRELENVIERAVALHDGETALTSDDLPPQLRSASATPTADVSRAGSEERPVSPNDPLTSVTRSDEAVQTSAGLAAWLADQIVRSEATVLQQNRVDYAKSVKVIKAALLDLSQRKRVQPISVSLKEFFDRTWPLLDDQLELRELKWMTGESRIMGVKGRVTVMRLTKLALKACE